MKQDVINWSKGIKGTKLVSKETLNHPGIIEKITGLDIYSNTPDAFLMAYEALGIDIVNRVPSENAPHPTPLGQKIMHPEKPYFLTNLGVYDTAFRHQFVISNPEEVFGLNIGTLRYSDLIVPVPHPCNRGDILAREGLLGDIGLYYPMLYTTVFMWPVETLGWENFMIAAMTSPKKFADQIIKPCAEKSKNIVNTILSTSSSPFVFLHDDLADGNGPIFPLNWYKDYIFPHYLELFRLIKSKHKKIIFVADGNMTLFLPDLIGLGIDGLMCENPATPFDIAIDYFCAEGKFLIGGIETSTLSFGTPYQVKQMVEKVAEKTRNCPGFAISSCGGLHGNIPMANIETYFDARSEIGATPKNWRNYFD